MKKYFTGTLAPTVSLDEVEELAQPSYEPSCHREVRRTELINRVSGKKRYVVSELLKGESFYSISKKNKNMTTSEVYRIKAELEKDYSFIYEEAKRKKYLKRNSARIKVLLEGAKEACRNLSLTEFQRVYIDDYDPEAQEKNWGVVPLQDTYFDIWENNAKSMTQAPREHLKTTSLISYFTKKIFERQFPLEIDYFHLSKEIAIDKIRKMQLIVERNPILSLGFELDQAKNWKDGEIRLLDGTTIKAMGWLQGSVGKHPHMIGIDDVIDQSVIYSDDRNKKAINKFYSDVYPMITKMTEEKKIIIIGTAQRDDDLYNQLPEDFERNIYQAFTDDEETKPLEPALFSVDELHKIKADMSEKHGLKFWLKEYMNVPFSSMGMIIKPEWIQTYSEPPKDLDIYQGWDLSVGKKLDEGDWTAGCTVGIREVEDKLEIYVLDMYKARIPFAERLKAIRATAKKHDPKKIAIEENTFQYDTVQTLKKKTNLPIVGVNSVRNKIERFQTELAPHFENKKVFIRADMDEFIKELKSLPSGKHDDMSDALALAIKVSAKGTKQPNIRIL